MTQLFALRPEEVQQLLAEGITSAANLANFRFFANDFKTRTDGVDLVGAWQPAMLGDRTRIAIALNLTKTRVVASNPNPTAIGNAFSSRAPFDTNGLFGYARIEYGWGIERQCQGVR